MVSTLFLAAFRRAVDATVFLSLGCRRRHLQCSRRS